MLAQHLCRDGALRLTPAAAASPLEQIFASSVLVIQKRLESLRGRETVGIRQMAASMR
jgi:hypothetical protein